MRETVDTRELREREVDLVDVWEALEGRADRGAVLPGMILLIWFRTEKEYRKACRAGMAHEV